MFQDEPEVSILNCDHSGFKMNPRCQLLAPFLRQIASVAATAFWPDGTPLGY